MKIHINEKRIGWVFFISLVAVICIAKMLDKDDPLIDNGKLTTATITSCRNGRNRWAGNVVCQCTYFVRGKLYENRVDIDINPRNADTLIDKKIPVFYDSLHPEVSIMLITSRDYETNKLIRPDSLSWVDSLY
ncbi:MAG: hypothetical protein J0L99_05960 [Chitinophagales bacterium]|nr:hypothetical protein [Chitinophagales bacterium]